MSLKQNKAGKKAVKQASVRGRGIHLPHCSHRKFYLKKYRLFLYVETVSINTIYGRKTLCNPNNIHTIYAISCLDGAERLRSFPVSHYNNT